MTSAPSSSESFPPRVTAELQGLLLSVDNVTAAKRVWQDVMTKEDRGNRVEQEIARKRTTLGEVEAERDQARLNLARAKTDDQYEAVAAIFDQLAERAKSLETEIAAAEGQLVTSADADSAVNAAMELIHQLTDLAADGENLEVARKIFNLLNARLFLAFHPVKVKKRTLNEVHSGMVTFGAAPPPIQIYEGPTARKKLKGPAASHATGPGERCLPSPPESCVTSGEEDKSSGNVSRGDWI